MHPNIYVYKCVVDDGTAPCIDRGLLSMTVCKPKVRISAKVGDVVLAFGTNAQPAPNRLVYAAKITKIIPNAAYFDSAKYQSRKVENKRFSARRPSRMSEFWIKKSCRAPGAKLARQGKPAGSSK